MRARPVSGAIVGALIGLVVVVIVQQAGAWPFDRAALFGLVGLGGMLGALAGALGRQGSRTTLVVVLVLFAIVLGWGLTGLAAANETGEINGGCTVEAVSDLDETTVTDTSRGDPFDVAVDGDLAWSATSPAPIQDYSFEIWVDVGGFQVPIDAEENTNGDLNTENVGIVSVADYAGLLEDATGVEPRGTYIVGGVIEGEGGACDGFAFVRIPADGLFDGPIAIAAWILLVILLVILVLIVVTGRGGPPLDNGIDGPPPPPAGDA